MVTLINKTSLSFGCLLLAGLFGTFAGLLSRAAGLAFGLLAARLAVRRGSAFRGALAHRLLAAGGRLFRRTRLLCALLLGAGLTE